MNLKKTAGLILAFSLGLSGMVSASEIVIGVPNWPSVKATADILKYVI